MLQRLLFFTHKPPAPSMLLCPEALPVSTSHIFLDPALALHLIPIFSLARLLKWFYLFIFRQRRREGERERNINVWLPLMRPLLGTQPETQACALIGNRTSDPMVRRPVLNPLNHTSQGCLTSILTSPTFPTIWVCLHLGATDLPQSKHVKNRFTTFLTVHTRIGPTTFEPSSC